MKLNDFSSCTTRTMKRSKILRLVFISSCIFLSYALDDEVLVINNNLGDLEYEPLDALHFADEEQRVSVVERDIPSDTAARVRRQVFVAGGGLKVQDLTARQDCDGILLQWNRLLPFSPNKPTSNGEFKHFNIYRSTRYFDNVMGMTPHVSGERDQSLQNPGKINYKDMYPPGNRELYYAVTVVDGEGQEDKAVEAKKTAFVGAKQKSGQLFKLVPGFLSRQGKVLHHSTAWNSNRNEYLVAFDFDVDNDNLPDQLFALRLDTSGRIVDKRMLNFTANINKKAGNQGWPSVVYNIKDDEYMIAFQFRSGVRQYFNNKYIIISQRVMSSQTERAAAPSLLVKGTGKGSPKHWIDAMNPIIKFNRATGGYVGAVVLEENRKEVVGLFVDSKGKLVKGDSVCSFKGNAYEPNIFFDSKRDEFFFTCTVQSGGIADADFNLKAGAHMVVLTKRGSNGEHASNTEKKETKNFVGYTNNTLAKTTGYYNEQTDRLILFWEDNDEGRPFLSTASVLLTRQRYLRDVKPYSCSETKRVRTPSAIYFPVTGHHFLFWEEQGRGTWVIGGEFLQGNLQLMFGRQQKNPVTLYNKNLQGAFVTWQEGGVLLARQIFAATRPLCSPLCTSQQTCAVQDKCVSKTGDSCTLNNGGCSHACTSLRQWKVQCSCPADMQLMGDRKTCQNVPPCHGKTPVINPQTKRDYFCGRGAPRNDCPANAYCHISAVDAFAKCCPAPLSSYSVLVAATSSIWQLFVDTKQDRAIFQKLQIDNPDMIVALDYNPVDKRIYWSDTSGNAIKRMSVTGVGGVDALVWKDVGVVDGLTLDVDDELLYWTDVTYQNIQRADLDGGDRRTILKGLDKPRAIVLYKARRLMYWADWGTIPKIERSDLDGGNRQTIVQGDLKWPNGLVIDQASLRLFWADAGLDKIETSNLMGRERRVLLSAPHVNHPYSLAILNNRLFWSDWETKGIHSVDKETGKDVETIAQGLDRPTGFAVFRSAPPVDTRIRCPDPGNPRNGDRHPSPEEEDDYPQGTVIRYTCFPQFNIHGPVTRTCMDDGKWSDKAPECLTPPRFRETPSNKTLNEAESAILACSASTSDTKITWYKDGKLVSGDNFATVRNGNLLILAAYLRYKGWYVCNATNRAGTKLARAYLKVLRPLDADCGRPTLATRGRIVNGKKVEKGSYPWMASLWDTSRNRHFCGGSLVANRWVVTAAHCVASIKPGDIEVRLGKLFVDKIRHPEPESAQIIRACKTILHHQFSTERDDFDSDIALIELCSDAVFTDYVRPICLPLRKEDEDKSLLKPGKYMVITGWGGKKEHGRTLKRMHQVTLPIVEQTLCKKAHRKYPVTSNMFCAGHHDGSVGDACQGDSGGPLALDNSQTVSDDDQRWVLAGIVSWGDGCGRIGKYGVYTKVSAFVRWIINNISD